MYSKVNYTIVGLFVVLFGVGMVWAAFWLAKYGLHERYKTYKIEMKESIAGLSKDSSVKLHGVDIGRVTQIRINPDDIETIEIYVDIREDVPIKEDMVATTQMLGVTGLLSIEIDGGSNEAKTLQPRDGYIPTIPSKPSMLTKLTENIDDISYRFLSLLERSEALLSHANLSHVNKILSNVEKLTSKGEALEDQALHSMKELDRSMALLRRSMQSITTKFEEATGDFSKMQKDFREIKEGTLPLLESFEESSRVLQRTTVKFEKSLERGDYNLQKIFEPMLIEIQQLSNQLSSMIRELRQSPNELLFKSRESRRGPGE